MPKANVWLQFQYCTCVCWCFFYVCSPNLVALVLGFFDASSRHHVPKYYCGYIYIYICVFIWCGVINLVWGYCIANQNHCMTTNLCLGFLFWKHTAFNQTQGRKPGAGCGRKRPWWGEDTPIEWIDYHTPIYSVSNSTKGKIKMKGQTLVKVIIKEIVVSQCNPF